MKSMSGSFSSLPPGLPQVREMIAVADEAVLGQKFFGVVAFDLVRPALHRLDDFFVLGDADLRHREKSDQATGDTQSDKSHGGLLSANSPAGILYEVPANFMAWRAELREEPVESRKIRRFNRAPYGARLARSARLPSMNW